MEKIKSKYFSQGFQDAMSGEDPKSPAFFVRVEDWQEHSKGYEAGCEMADYECFRNVYKSAHGVNPSAAESDAFMTMDSQERGSTLKALSDSYSAK